MAAPSPPSRPTSACAAPGPSTRRRRRGSNSALTAGGTGAIRAGRGRAVGRRRSIVTALQGAGIVQIDQAGNALPVVSRRRRWAPSTSRPRARSKSAAPPRSGGSVTYRGTDITLSDRRAGAGQVDHRRHRAHREPDRDRGRHHRHRGAGARCAPAPSPPPPRPGEVRLTGDNTVGTWPRTARDGIALRATGATTVGRGRRRRRGHRGGGHHRHRRRQRSR